GWRRTGDPRIHAAWGEWLAPCSFDFCGDRHYSFSQVSLLEQTCGRVECSTSEGCSRGDSRQQLTSPNKPDAANPAMVSRLHGGCPWRGSLIRDVRQYRASYAREYTRRYSDEQRNSQARSQDVGRWRRCLRSHFVSYVLAECSRLQIPLCS